MMAVPFRAKSIRNVSALKADGVVIHMFIDRFIAISPFRLSASVRHLNGGALSSPA